MRAACPERAATSEELPPGQRRNEHGRPNQRNTNAKTGRIRGRGQSAGCPHHRQIGRISSGYPAGIQRIATDWAASALESSFPEDSSGERLTPEER